MSWSFEDLAPVVQTSVRANAGTAAFACGCEERGDRWYLCMYHEGAQDAAGRLAVAVAERDNLILALSGTADRSQLTIDEAELWDRIVGRGEV